jgi:hypothetical protein
MRITTLAEVSGLSYYTVLHILHGQHAAGWYAAARLRRALRELGLAEESEPRCA